MGKCLKRWRSVNQQIPCYTNYIIFWAEIYTLFKVNVWTDKPLVEKYGEDKVIVTILTDRAERNFSIALI